MRPGLSCALRRRAPGPGPHRGVPSRQRSIFIRGVQNCFARRAPLALFPKGGADFSDKMAAVSEILSEVVLARHRAPCRGHKIEKPRLFGPQRYFLKPPAT
ncbi:protein of unknown function [Methylocella tundrae]|uniref:Uncharacterized protein n=1 Tax=Methylocella tundrae TaxID=227605 RepID=A0A4U8YWG5_METTU|nr:protein of unknown function [Methylocella tundrae]